MSNISVLLTGITGFIGSHLAKSISQKYEVIGLVRKSSDLSRYNEIKNANIRLINPDDKDQLKELNSLSPKFLIHSAWGGVGAANRDDWSAQVENIIYTTWLLGLAKDLDIPNFISFGSQAEYQPFKGRVDESQPCKPVTAYGASKVATFNIMEAFCTRYNINWNWFRLFSVYGTGEGFNWFIPSVIKNALQNTSMELTACEQRYDYLYATDLGGAIIKVIEHGPAQGVYNLSSNGSRPLKEIIEKIRDKTGTRANFKLGALPYREGQVMHMEGNSEKFYNTFNFALVSDFDANIDQLIKYYQAKL